MMNNRKNSLMFMLAAMSMSAGYENPFQEPLKPNKEVKPDPRQKFLDEVVIKQKGIKQANITIKAQLRGMAARKTILVNYSNQKGLMKKKRKYEGMLKEYLSKNGLNFAEEDGMEIIDNI